MNLVRCRFANHALAFCLLLSAEVSQASEQTDSPQTLQCAVTYNGELKRPWLNYATQRFLDVDIRNGSVTDRTIEATPYRFRIITENTVWVVATTNDQKFLNGYLDYAEHQPKLAKVSINRRNLEISLEVQTNPHIDPAPDAAFWRGDPHVGTYIYSGTCSVVKQKI